VKTQEEILQSFNMLKNHAKMDSSTKPQVSARQLEASKTHSKRDGHGNDRKSRNRIILHHSIEKSTGRYHASSRPGRNPSVSPVRRQRRRHEGYIL
jgi:hypothetical protein